jgi:hypothetical protein
MSPQSALAWGITGLVVIASAAAIFWLFHSRIGPEAKQQALSQILGWSDQIAGLEENGSALSPKEGLLR